MKPKKKILFLCTGNYFRSRFTEIYFNHLCRKKNMAWKASSRGLRILKDGSKNNYGPVSIFAFWYLIKRGIFSITAFRFPVKASNKDFMNADYTIALKESEHRRFMNLYFPEWENRIEYWNIDDVDVSPPEDILPELEKKIGMLIENRLDDQ